MANDLLQNKFIKGFGAPTNVSEGARRLTPAPGPSGQRADGLLGGEGERAQMAEGAPRASMIAGFLNAVERIEKILELETQMLEENKPIVLHDLNHRKSHGLLELRRAMSACRSLDRSVFEAETKAPLARLRKKLERNLVRAMHETG